MGVVWLGLSAARGCPNHLCHRLLGSKPLPAGRASSHPERSAIERAAAPGGGVCCPRGLNEPGFLEKCSRLFFLCSPPSLMPSASNPGPAFPQRRIFHFICSLAACWSRAMALLTLHRVLQSSPYSWWTYQPHKILEVTPPSIGVSTGHRSAYASGQAEFTSTHKASYCPMHLRSLQAPAFLQSPEVRTMPWGIISAWSSVSEVEVNHSCKHRPWESGALAHAGSLPPTPLLPGRHTQL